MKTLSDCRVLLVDDAKVNLDILVGGWGIQRVRRYTDKVSYTRVDGANELRLTRQIDATTGQK